MAGGRQRLYEKDRRVTTVIEESLYRQLESHAKKKGITVSRLISLTLKAAFTPRLQPKMEEQCVHTKGTLSELTLE